MRFACKSLSKDLQLMRGEVSPKDKPLLMGGQAVFLTHRNDLALDTMHGHQAGCSCVSRTVSSGSASCLL